MTADINSSSDSAGTKAAVAAQAIYRLTDLTAFDPALKFELRRKAAEILGRVAGFSMAALAVRSHRQEQLEDLYSALAATTSLVKFARKLELISAENAAKVAAAYDALRELLERSAEAAADAQAEVPPGQTNSDSKTQSGDTDEEDKPTGLNHRQKKILWYLKNAEQAQISDLRLMFGEEISEKTLQRDLLNLANSGFIRRTGDYRWTTYAYAPSPEGDALIAEVLAAESASDSDIGTDSAIDSEMA